MSLLKRSTNLFLDLPYLPEIPVAAIGIMKEDIVDSIFGRR